jgi:hypothetical protein
MEHIEAPMEQHVRKKRRIVNGRIYFSRAAERKFFFSLTVMMLLLGILFKLGVLQ